MSSHELASLTITEYKVVLVGHTRGLLIETLLIESDVNQLKVVPPNASTCIVSPSQIVVSLEEDIVGI